MKKATSVGGIIVRSNNGQPEILLIRHLDYDDWFLPKGHVEAGETLEQAALREIKEETNLAELEIGDYLGSFERYAETAGELKTEHYFLIRKTSDDEARIELGQNWTIGWFTKDKLPVFYLKEQEKIVRDNWEKIQSIMF